MDEKRRSDLRRSIQFAETCEGNYVTDEQVESCIDAMAKAEANPREPQLCSVEELDARAVARSEKEGISVSAALEVESRLEHEAYWAKRRKQSTPSGSAS